jgi:hypothetical protein
MCVRERARVLHLNTNVMKLIAFTHSAEKGHWENGGGGRGETLTEWDSTW